MNEELKTEIGRQWLKSDKTIHIITKKSVLKGRGHCTIPTIRLYLFMNQYQIEMI